MSLLDSTGAIGRGLRGGPTLRALGAGPADVLDCSAARRKALGMRDSTEQVYALADEIRDRCLGHLDSLLTPGESVWTSAAAKELVTYFVDAPDTGRRSFLDKLGSQLAEASPQAIRLMAELAVIYEMAPVNVGVPATEVEEPGFSQ